LRAFPGTVVTSFPARRLPVQHRSERSCPLLRSAADASGCSGHRAPVTTTCPAVYYPSAVMFSDNMENTGSGRWVFGGGFFRYSSGDPNSGALSLHAQDLSGTVPANYYATMSTPVTLPATGKAVLRFNHDYGFSTQGSVSLSGGHVEYSTDGGTAGPTSRASSSRTATTATSSTPTPDLRRLAGASAAARRTTSPRGSSCPHWPASGSRSASTTPPPCWTRPAGGGWTTSPSTTAPRSSRRRRAR